MLQVSIPSGFTHYRLLGGIPLAAALVGGFIPILLFCLVSWLSAFISTPFITVLWLFAAHQTARDPAWFVLWLLHLQLKGYYAAS